MPLVLEYTLTNDSSFFIFKDVKATWRIIIHSLRRRNSATWTTRRSLLPSLSPKTQKYWVLVRYKRCRRLYICLLANRSVRKTYARYFKMLSFKNLLVLMCVYFYPLSCDVCKTTKLYWQNKIHNTRRIYFLFAIF